MSSPLQVLGSLLPAAGLLAGVLGAGARRLDTRLQSYAGQSLALGLFAALLATAERRPHVYVMAAVALVLKCGWLPRFLGTLARRHRLRTPREGAGPGAAAWLLAAGLLAALVHRAASPLGQALAEGIPPWIAGALPAGLTAAALGLLAIARDREPTSLVLGLLMLENGVVFAALAIPTAGPVPLVMLLLFEGACAFLLLAVLDPLLAERASGPMAERLGASGEKP